TPIGDVPLGLCQFDFGGFWSLVPEEERNIGYVELTHRLSDRVDSRVEFHIADNEAFSNTSPSFPFARFPIVEVTHPDNLYGPDVQVIGCLIGAGAQQCEGVYKITKRRIAETLSGEEGVAWQWEFGDQFTENDFVIAAPDVLVDRFSASI